MTRIIAIDGNIGAGKTTFIDRLEKICIERTDIFFLREPVDEWIQFKDSSGESILDKFYQDPHKYTFAFQLTVFNTILASLKKALSNPKYKIIICERSIASSRHVFMDMLYKDNMVNYFEYKIYEDLFTKDIVDNYYPTEILYLNVSVKTCSERISKRNRQGEQNIKTDYLERCHYKYLEWIYTGGINCKIIDVEDVSDMSFIVNSLLYPRKKK